MEKHNAKFLSERLTPSSLAVWVSNPAAFSTADIPALLGLQAEIWALAQGLSDTNLVVELLVQHRLVCGYIDDLRFGRVEQFEFKLN